MNMFEQMARAICRAGGCDPDAIYPGSNQPAWAFAGDAVLAVLEAMKEPDPQMIECARWETDEIKATNIWKQMLNGITQSQL